MNDNMVFEGKLLLDKYEMGKIIGRGGTGNVYEAYDRHLRQVVAVKEIVSGGQDGIKADSLWNEAAILKQLDHPALPKIYDYFGEADCVYMVMEYIRGITLAEYIRENGPLGQSSALMLMWRLLSVFEYLHSFSPPVIYRDLKPSNIMLEEGGRLRLIDFGTAVYRADCRSAGRSAGAVIAAGTPGFTAPEWLDGSYRGELRENSDIYSLGAVLYFLLTGREPRLSIARYCPWRGSRRPVRRYNKKTSAGIEKIVGRCLHVKPAKRYSGIGQLKSELKNHRNLSGGRRLKTKIGRLCRLLLPVAGMTLIIREVGPETLPFRAGIELWSWNGEGGFSAIMAAGFILLLGGLYNWIIDHNRRQQILKREKSFFLTAKKTAGLWGGGLLLIALAAMLTYRTPKVYADTADLPFTVRDVDGHKLLIKQGSFYRPAKDIIIELPLSAFPPNEELTLKIMAIGESGCYESRDFPVIIDG